MYIHVCMHIYMYIDTEPTIVYIRVNLAMSTERVETKKPLYTSLFS